MHEREWIELGQIDYFLEQLARAVERGEVAHASYDRLAPRYLERRADLAAIITGSPRATSPPGGSAQDAPPPAEVMLAGPEAPRTTSLLPAPAAGGRMRVSWTTALIVTGAVLVIVAAAVFAIAAWQHVGPLVRLALLGAFTAAFYAAGDRVRSRLGLDAGGTALTVVASAMLLFDGWIVIDGYSLTGPLPWAAWMLVCSVVYWYAEVRLAGGFFGVVGAAAQVGWWWLLAEGFELDVAPRLAVLAVVVAAWAVTASRVREAAATASLAAVLRVVSSVAGIVIAAVFVPVSLTEGPDLGILLCAAAVGWSYTVVVEVLKLPRLMAGGGHVPWLFLLLAADGSDGRTVAALAAAAVAFVVYELSRGGVAVGVMGLATEIGWVAALGRLLRWSDSGMVLALSALAVSWMLVRYLSVRFNSGDASPSERVSAFGVAAEIGAWLVLVAATVWLPFASGPPLVAWDVTWFETVVAFLVVIAWLVPSLLLRRPGALGASVSSMIALACVLDVLDADWVGSLLGLAFLALLGLWSSVAGWLERTTGLDRNVLRLTMRAVVPVVAAVALLADAWYGRLPSWEGAVLLATVALWLAADGALTRTSVLFSVAAPVAVSAVAMFGGWRGDAPGAAVGAAAAASAIAAAGLARARLQRPLEYSPWTAAAAGLSASFLVYDDALPLAVAFALSGVACACAAEATRTRVGHFFAGLAGAGALWALLAHLGHGPWVTVVTTGAYGFVLLAPAALPAARSGGEAGRVGRALAASGGVATLVPVILGFEAIVSSSQTTEWWRIVDWAWPVALAVFGGYLLAASVTFVHEPLIYGGVGVLLLAYWAGLAQANVDRIEYFSIAGGLFVAWCGARWAGRAPGRTVPLVADVAATAITLGVPSLALLDPGASAASSWEHTFWAFGLGIVAIGLGVLLRVRTYFLGGIAALVWTALVRSWTYLVDYWWIVLGVVGTGMIVVALTRERQRAVLDDVRDMLGGWR